MTSIINRLRAISPFYYSEKGYEGVPTLQTDSPSPDTDSDTGAAPCVSRAAISAFGVILVLTNVVTFSMSRSRSDASSCFRQVSDDLFPDGMVQPSNHNLSLLFTADTQWSQFPSSR